MERSKGGITSRSSFRFYYRLPRASCTASLCALLTGCLATASNFGRAAASERLIAPIQSTGGRDSTSSSDQFNLFWDAIADLDIPATRAAASTRSQTDLADGVAALASANNKLAEAVFERLISDDTDPNVSSAARLLLAATLMYEHKWAALRSFTAATHFRSPSLSGVSGIQKWGDAFAGIDSQTIEFPVQQMTLPLAITPVGTPTVQVRIHGKDYRFWLDTGSSMTVVSSDVALEAGIQALRGDTLTIATFAGVAPARPAVVPRMEIGSAVVTNSPAIVIESGLMRVQSNADGVPWSGLPVDGIIGWDLIRRFDISLDYGSGKSIWQEPRDLETLGTESQNLTWVGKPLIRLLTKSGVTLHLTLDTGSQSSFLSARVLRKAQATASSTDARAYGIAGTGGQQLARATTPLRVEVAGKSLMLRDLIVYSPGSQGLINCDGILGSDVAQFGTIRIDATNGLFSVG
jgi:aspartyl protease